MSLVGINNITMDQLIEAIGFVESRNDDNAVGDDGLAIGRYQIHKAYWIDGTEFLGVDWKYPGDAKNPEKAKAVVRAYLTRYGKEKTIEQLARIHNGGPTGWNKQSTEKYWTKIENHLKERSSAMAAKKSKKEERTLSASVEDGFLVIRVPLNDKPTPSRSGRNLTVATTHGNVPTEAMIDGRPVTIGVNAYIRAR